MALSDIDYKNALIALYNKAKEVPMSPEDYAEEFSKITNVQIKTGRVKSGILVSTQGSATAQTGQTTSEGEIT